MGQEDTPRNLRKNVLSGIRTYEYQRARKFLIASACTGALSLAGVVGSLWYLVVTIPQTSFYYYLSLVFTDTDLVLPYWKEFALSLAETAPLFGIALVLVGVVVFLLSLRTFVGHTTRSNVLPSFSM